jgi:hypothetical protein
MNKVIPRDWANWLSGIFGSGSLVVFFAWMAAAALTAVTVSDMAAVPAEVWRTGGRSARAWRWTAMIGVLVAPLGLVVSALWWIRIARDLPHSASANWTGPSWPAAAGRTRHEAGRVLAVMGFLALLTTGARSLEADPETVNITQLGHDIEPRPYIASQCPDSVLSVGHIADPAFGADPDLERWEVTPRAGHVDIVLLNVETGEVICP